MSARTPIPPRARLKALRRARWRCEDCGARSRLDMHHLRYQRESLFGLVPIFGGEAADDLAVLCRPCHQRRHIDHNGRFWRDPEERKQREQGTLNARA